MSESFGDMDDFVFDLPDEPIGSGPSGVDMVVAGEHSAVLVPDMRESGMGTSTKGKGMVPVTAPEGTNTVDFRNTIISAYMQYIESGVVSVERVVADTGLTEPVVSTIMASENFRYACRVRGFDIGPQRTGLTTEQDLFLQIYLDPTDGLSLQKKMRKAGVSMTKYRAWLKNPIFKQHIDKFSEQLLAENSNALVQLERLVGEGNLRAIQFKLEMNNRYNPRREQAIDVLAIMNSVMEVLARNVQDPQVLMAVATEMKQIAEGAQLGITIEG